MKKVKTTVWLLLVAILSILCLGCGAKKSAPEKQTSDGMTQSAENEAELKDAGKDVDAAESEAAATNEDAAENQDEQIDYLSIYAPVLNEVYAVLRDGFDEEGDYWYTSFGVIETAQWSDSGDALDSVGYAIMDVSGDGIPELLVGTIPVVPSDSGAPEVDTPDAKSMLLEGYTCQDGALLNFLEGYARSRYQWMGGDRFYYHGSSGAMYTMFGAYQLIPDGTQLICEDCYFTDLKGGSDSEIGFYHNTLGAWDMDVSEELDLSEDAFWAVQQAYEDQCVSPELTAFSNYPYAEYADQTGSGTVRVDYAADVLPNLDYFEDVSSSETAIEDKVVFQTAEDVEDFKVLALELQDVDENGHAVFSVAVVYEQPVLQAGVPLVVPMTFPGDTPHDGFSYVDEEGITRQFSISVSGMDGSLITAPLD